MKNPAEEAAAIFKNSTPSKKAEAMIFALSIENERLYAENQRLREGLALVRNWIDQEHLATEQGVHMALIAIDAALGETK